MRLTYNSPSAIEIMTMRALGLTDAVTSCDCCGKAGLKCTVVMEREGGEIVHYGRTCAARNSGKSGATIDTEIKERQNLILREARSSFRASAEYRAEREAYDSRPRELSSKAAGEWVKNAGLEADARCKEIAERFGVAYWAIRNA